MADFPRHFGDPAMSLPGAGGGVREERGLHRAEGSSRRPFSEAASRLPGVPRMSNWDPRFVVTHSF